MAGPFDRIARRSSSQPQLAVQGVSYDEKRGTYKARIFYAGQERYIGRYPSVEQAALAYDQAARYINKLLATGTSKAQPHAKPRARVLNFPGRCPNDPKVERRLHLMFRAEAPTAALDKSPSDVAAAHLEPDAAAVSTAETAATVPASSKGAVAAATATGAQAAAAHTTGTAAGAVDADTRQQTPAGNGAALVASSTHFGALSAQAADPFIGGPSLQHAAQRTKNQKNESVNRPTRSYTPQKRQRMPSADPAATSTSTVQDCAGPTDTAGGQHTPLSMPRLLLPAQHTQQQHKQAPQQQHQQTRTAETPAGAQAAAVGMPMVHSFVVADDQDWEQLLALINRNDDRNDEARIGDRSAFAGQVMQQAWGPGDAIPAPLQQQQEMSGFNSSSSDATATPAQPCEVAARPGPLGGGNCGQAPSVGAQSVPEAPALAALLPGGHSPKPRPLGMARAQGVMAAASMATAAVPTPPAAMGWLPGMDAGVGSAYAAPILACSARWLDAAAGGGSAGQPWSPAEAGWVSAGTGTGISTLAHAAAAGVAAAVCSEATGLLSCIQNPQQAIAVTNRARQCLEDLTKHVQQQQFSAGGAVGAVWDWLQAAWFIEAVHSGGFAASSFPASIAAATSAAREAVLTAHSPTRLVLCLLDCLVRLCAGAPAAHSGTAAACAFVCELLQQLQLGMAAVQRFVAAAAPDAAVNYGQLFQAYVLSLQVPGEASAVVSVLWALAQLL